MIGRRALGIVLAASGTFASAALALAAGTGSISGTVAEPAAVLAVAAVDRETARTYPGTLDAATGRFDVAGLPEGARVDCRIDYRDGARLEGVDLDVPRSDYEEEQPLSSDDVATLKAQARSLNQFEDEVEVLAVSGNIQHAAALVQKLRTRAFVNAKPGEVVWRVELWRFERPDETWLKSRDLPSPVLYRLRLPKDEYAKKSLTFDPTIGGIAVAGERPAAVPGPIARPPATAGIRLRSLTRRPGVQ